MFDRLCCRATQVKVTHAVYKTQIQSIHRPIQRVVARKRYQAEVWPSWQSSKIRWKMGSHFRDRTVVNPIIEVDRWEKIGLFAEWKKAPNVQLECSMFTAKFILVFSKRFMLRDVAK